MAGCLLRLALLPLIVGTTWVLLSLRTPFPTFAFAASGAEVAGPAAGFFFWFAVLYLLDARQARARLALALDARVRHLQDGEDVVVYGTLQALGPLLEAPFSGESCVGYEYMVYHRSAGMRSDQVDFHGYALTPSAVRGAMGTVNILAGPDKELFYELPFERLDGDEAFSRAEAYLKATDFGKPGGLFGDVSRREIVEGPGSFRIDVSSGPKTELRSCYLQQKVLRPGEDVNVAGVYSEPGRGIGPNPHSIMKPFHIVRGGEAALARKIRSKRTGAIVSALLGLTVLAVYLLVVGPALS